MTTRPTQHELEDISRVKFQLALPRRWVFRDKVKDYGIDGEVELFDENKKAQGLIFYIQLKATESKEESTIMNVDLSIEALKYYKKLDIPVLLVRYSDYKDSIYVKWVNKVDLFFAKKNAKTYRIKLEEKHLWDTNSSGKIENRLANIRKLKSGHFNFPLPYSIKIKQEKIRDLSKAVLFAQIRSELKSYSDYIEYENIKDSIIEIIIDKGELKINVCDLCGCSFHNIETQSYKDFALDLSKDIMLGFATALIQIGQIEYCGRIIFSNNLHKRLLEKKELLIYLLPPLFQSSYFDKILELIGEILNSDFSIEMEIITTINILIGSKSNSKVKNSAIEEFLRKRLQNSIEKQENIQVGVAHYNLGNHYRGRGFYLESIRHYNAAKRFAPIYLQQHYFFSELAGVLFLSKKFKISAKLYCKSIELGASDKTKALYADALMFSGEYEKSKDTFIEYLESTDNLSEEFRLKAFCLDSILEKKKIKSQHRRSTEAMNKADISKFEKGTTPKEQLEKIFELDLLCGLAWFNLGILQSEDSEYDQALFSFIMAGIVQNNDIEAWKNATLCSFVEKKQIGIIPLVILTAYFFNGDEYLEALYTHLEKNNKTLDISQITEMIETILPERDKKDTLPIVRVLNNNGIFENIFEK